MKSIKKSRSVGLLFFVFAQIGPMVFRIWGQNGDLPTFSFVNRSNSSFFVAMWT